MERRERVTAERAKSGWAGRHRTRGWAIALPLLAATVVLIGTVSGMSPSHSPRSGTRPVAFATGAGGVPSVSAASSPSATSNPLLLSVSANPSSICVLEGTSCSAGVGLSRVTLTASAPPATYESWPAVQVAFVIETTLYDGVYDPTVFDYGHDACANQAGASGPACEESNGVPFFVANAQSIANAIQSANPHSTVSFALVDYFASLDVFDDSDGSEYHVDIPRFIPASQFGSQVQQTLGTSVLEPGYRYSDSDFSDNILHSSSITALYGAIIGSGLNWSANTHHVVVWIGDTAPRAAGYTQDYDVSPSSHVTVGSASAGTPSFSTPCEPSYSFGNSVSPQCEGWVTSQDANSSHSIAKLAQTSPSCTNSIGGVCTIDTIDLWSTPDDPYSPGWPAGDATTQLQGGPGGTMVDQNAARVLLAGCDLAAATGGTWNGPSFFTCPTGQSGSLSPSFLGPYANPNLQNPSLLAALRGIGFGPVTSSLVATGTDHPLFSFVPFGSIEVLPGSAAQFRTACILADGSNSPHCPVEPVESTLITGPDTTTTVFTWNWSTVASQNLMYGGDTWIASFWVLANGPPFGLVPVDACTTSACAMGGSRAIDGHFTVATYLPTGAASPVAQSFPLGTVNVESPPSAAPPPSLPPPTATPPPPAIPAPSPLSIISPIGVGAQVGVASLSLQAAAAGFIAAGFTAITVRNRPMTLAVAQLAQKSGPVRSRFEETMSSRSAEIGHFE